LGGGEGASPYDGEQFARTVQLAGLDQADQQRRIQSSVAAPVEPQIQHETINVGRVRQRQEPAGEVGNAFLLFVSNLVVLDVHQA
jgi:hypothetical protein